MANIGWLNLDEDGERLEMNLKKGDMWKTWDKENSLFCITTNSSINSKGELVMGKGIALQAKKKFPDLPRIAGKYISEGGRYGLIILKFGKNFMGLFQTKTDWRLDSSLDLIEYSCFELNKALSFLPWISEVNLNFPGIGNGNLDKKEVLSVLKDFGSEVGIKINIWELKVM